MGVPPQQTQHNFWFDTRPGSETMAQNQNKVEQIESTRTPAGTSCRQMPGQCWAGVSNTEQTKTHTGALAMQPQRLPSTEATQSEIIRPEIIRPYIVPAGVALEHYQHKHNTLATRCSLSEHETPRQC